MSDENGRTPAAGSGGIDWRARFWEFFRFGLVGVANTAVYYVFYRVFLIFLPYLGAHVLGWAVSTVFSFFMNSYFTFHVKPTWKRFVAFPVSSLVNLGVSSGGSVLLISLLGVSDKWGTLIAGIIAIPFTFAVMRLVFVSKRLGSAEVSGGDASSERGDGGAASTSAAQGQPDD